MTNETRNKAEEAAHPLDEEAVEARSAEQDETEQSQRGEDTTPEQTRTKLEQAQAEAAEYLEGWRRTQAEFANYRRREEAEWERRTQMSNVGLLLKTLPVLDDLQRAVETMPEELSDLVWAQAIDMIKPKLETVLEAEGVRPIETEGRAFDPTIHEAITYEEAKGYEEGQIISEVQRGYTLAERVIRPALVRVARAPAEPVSIESQAEEES